MGMIRSTESLEAEVGELRQALRAGVVEGGRWTWGAGAVLKSTSTQDQGEHGRLVCVTSGLSFLGFALVNRLLARGYTVRLALETQEDLDKVREMEMFGEMGRDGVWAVLANVMDVGSLCRAFDGCVGVFHTSAFADPSGVSGYTKHMADMEVKVAERVIQACVTTQSVRKCVFTSSLLACIWRRNSPLNCRVLVDETSWSDETLCRDKKLWFALGKTMAEKAAWRVARGRNLKLVTLCPALVTGPGFSRRNSTASIAYLKGAQEMLAEGLLATTDVHRVANAHIIVYEEMDGTACGRYICFDHIIIRGEEVAELERQLRIPNRISAETTIDHPTSLVLCNRKLSRLMTTSRRCSSDTYSILDS